jgi:D-arabinose 1-dehydrogenase-like Zn-dependent alcohol dehydrogenase
MPTTYRAVEVTEPNKFELVDRPLQNPPAGHVRIRVDCCGICHSDCLTVDNAFPGLSFPRVPGHEVAGTIDAVGSDVPQFRAGERVGVGWNGGYCGRCNNCRGGDFFACERTAVTGVTYDGGWAEYMIAPAAAVARMPADLPPNIAAPIMCAGLTTFNALRNSGARAGDVVAILGLGGLGHLGVQYAAKMGYHTVGIARGRDKEPLARELGAARYIDSQATDPAAELQKLGGAKAVLATVTAGDAMTAAQGGLAIGGTLIVIGVPPSIEVSPLNLIMGNRSVRGWYSGTSIDSEDTLTFSARTGVKPMIETYPLEKTQEAFDRMLSGKARFRVVLTMGR